MSTKPNEIATLEAESLQASTLLKFFGDSKSLEFLGDFLQFPLAGLPSAFESNFVVFDAPSFIDSDLLAVLKNKISLFQANAKSKSSEFCLRVKKPNGKEIYIIAEHDLTKIREFIDFSENLDIKSDTSLKLIIVREGDSTFSGLESARNEYQELVSELLLKTGISVIECDKGCVSGTFAWLLTNKF